MCRGLPGGTSLVLDDDGGTSLVLDDGGTSLVLDDDGDEWGGSEAAMEQTSP